MSIWWIYRQNKGLAYRKFSTDLRMVLAQVLDQGLQGASVLSNLEELYRQALGEQELQMKYHLEKLPFRLLLPLLLCFFPAFLLLLFGPLVNEFLLEVTK